MPVVTSAPHTSNVTPNASLGDLATAGLGATGKVPVSSYYGDLLGQGHSAEICIT